MANNARSVSPNDSASNSEFIPIDGQCFRSKAEWVARARYVLTAHPEYLNTEHDGPEKGWRGPHFTALCFDQMGRRVRNGGDFQKAEDDGAYPIWWVWPDQIHDLIKGDWQSIGELARKLAEKAGK